MIEMRACRRCGKDFCKEPEGRAKFWAEFDPIYYTCKSCRWRTVRYGLLAIAAIYGAIVMLALLFP